MTRETIMQMSERELWIAVHNFTYPNEYELFLADKLYLCYQAEEKLDSQGLEPKYTVTLYHVLLANGLEDPTRFSFAMAHAHPKQRAQAILLTLEESDGIQGSKE